MAGGLKIDDPAMHLAICMSIVSSYEDKPLPQNVCFAGEVGLGGEIRAVQRIEGRISEAEKLGFEKIFISALNSKGIDKSRFNIQVLEAEMLADVFRYIAN